MRQKSCTEFEEKKKGAYALIRTKSVLAHEALHSVWLHCAKCQVDVTQHHMNCYISKLS